MCMCFSQIMNICKPQMKEGDFEERLMKAVRHLEFACKLYQIQIDQGGWILHEHPANATSWPQPCIEKILNRAGVKNVTGHMCQFGLTATRDDGTEAPVWKPTKFMSNCPMILEALSRICPKTHVHERLLGGKAKAAVYTTDLQDVICQALVQA